MEFHGNDDATSVGCPNKILAQSEPRCGEHGILALVLCRGPTDGSSPVHGRLSVCTAARPTRMHCVNEK